VSRRVVVTGLGVVTPVGVGVEQAWDELLAGTSGFRPVESFDTSRHTVHVGAEVRGFRAGDHLQTLEPSSLGRASQLAAAAARMAFADAGLDLADLDSARAGVAMGTTSGEPREVEKLDDRLIAGELDRIGPEFISL
jgi:3-oxoacyl-[acyl-carrier-protein] synthase II